MSSKKEKKDRAKSTYAANYKLAKEMHPDYSLAEARALAKRLTFVDKNQPICDELDKIKAEMAAKENKSQEKAAKKLKREERKSRKALKKAMRNRRKVVKKVGKVRVMEAIAEAQETGVTMEQALARRLDMKDKAALKRAMNEEIMRGFQLGQLDMLAESEIVRDEANWRIMREVMGEFGPEMAWKKEQYIREMKDNFAEGERKLAYRRNVVEQINRGLGRPLKPGKGYGRLPPGKRLIMPKMSNVIPVQEPSRPYVKGKVPQAFVLPKVGVMRKIRRPRRKYDAVSGIQKRKRKPVPIYPVSKKRAENLPALIDWNAWDAPAPRTPARPKVSPKLPSTKKIVFGPSPLSTGKLTPARRRRPSPQMSMGVESGRRRSSSRRKSSKRKPRALLFTPPSSQKSQRIRSSERKRRAKEDKLMTHLEFEALAKKVMSKQDARREASRNAIRARLASLVASESPSRRAIDESIFLKPRLIRKKAPSKRKSKPKPKPKIKPKAKPKAKGKGQKKTLGAARSGKKPRQRKRSRSIDRIIRSAFDEEEEKRPQSITKPGRQRGAVGVGPRVFVNDKGQIVMRESAKKLKRIPKKTYPTIAARPRRPSTASLKKKAQKARRQLVQLEKLEAAQRLTRPNPATIKTRIRLPRPGRQVDLLNGAIGINVNADGQQVNRQLAFAYGPTPKKRKLKSKRPVKRSRKTSPAYKISRKEHKHRLTSPTKWEAKQARIYHNPGHRWGFRMDAYPNPNKWGPSFVRNVWWEGDEPEYDKNWKPPVPVMPRYPNPKRLPRWGDKGFIGPRNQDKPYVRKLTRAEKQEIEWKRRNPLEGKWQWSGGPGDDELGGGLEPKKGVKRLRKGAVKAKRRTRVNVRARAPSRSRSPPPVFHRKIASAKEEAIDEGKARMEEELLNELQQVRPLTRNERNMMNKLRLRSRHEMRLIEQYEPNWQEEAPPPAWQPEQAMSYDAIPVSAEAEVQRRRGIERHFGLNLLGEGWAERHLPAIQAAMDQGEGHAGRYEPPPVPGPLIAPMAPDIFVSNREGEWANGEEPEVAHVHMFHMPVNDMPRGPQNEGKNRRAPTTVKLTAKRIKASVIEIPGSRNSLLSVVNDEGQVQRKIVPTRVTVNPHLMKSVVQELGVRENPFAVAPLSKAGVPVASKKPMPRKYSVPRSASVERLSRKASAKISATRRRSRSSVANYGPTETISRRKLPKLPPSNRRAPLKRVVPSHMARAMPLKTVPLQFSNYAQRLQAHYAGFSAVHPKAPVAVVVPERPRKRLADHPIAPLPPLSSRRRHRRRHHRSSRSRSSIKKPRVSRRRKRLTAEVRRYGELAKYRRRAKRAAETQVRRAEARVYGPKRKQRAPRNLKSRTALMSSIRDYERGLSQHPVDVAMRAADRKMASRRRVTTVRVGRRAIPMTEYPLVQGTGGVTSIRIIPKRSLPAPIRTQIQQGLMLVAVRRNGKTKNERIATSMMKSMGLRTQTSKVQKVANGHAVAQPRRRLSAAPVATQEKLYHAYVMRTKKKPISWWDYFNPG